LENSFKRRENGVYTSRHFDAQIADGIIEVKKIRHGEQKENTPGRSSANYHGLR